MNEIGNCPECGNTNLLVDNDVGELVCVRCGYVVSSTLINEGPEWRAFDLEEKETKSRMGAPLTLTMRDNGLSTVIGYGISDARGRKLKPRKMVQFKRLRKWHQRSWEIGFDPKSLTNGLRNINKVSYELGLPRNVLETASYIYRRAISEDLIKGRSVQTITAASIYLACRQCGVIRKIDEVSKAANLSRKEGARAIRFLLRRLDLDAPLYPFEGYISKYVSHLSLPGETEKIALTLADTAFRLKLTSGRGASSIAASCVYIACQVSGESRTQGDISKTAGVTEVTIRNRYKELVQNMKITFQL